MNLTTAKDNALLAFKFFQDTTNDFAGCAQLARQLCMGHFERHTPGTFKLLSQKAGEPEIQPSEGDIRDQGDGVRETFNQGLEDIIHEAGRGPHQVVELLGRNHQPFCEGIALRGCRVAGAS